MPENDALLSEKECIENPKSEDSNAHLSYIHLLEMRVELLNDKLKAYQKRYVYFDLYRAYTKSPYKP